VSDADSIISDHKSFRHWQACFECARHCNADRRGSFHSTYLVGLAVMIAVEVSLLPQVRETNVA